MAHLHFWLSSILAIRFPVPGWFMAGALEIQGVHAFASFYLLAVLNCLVSFDKVIKEENS